MIFKQIAERLRRHKASCILHDVLCLACCALCLGVLGSCRNEDIIFIPEEVTVTQPQFTEVTGLYVLNEGNMNTNKASLDYLDLTTGVYSRNIFAAANPYVAKELGDVGNDLGIYGNRLYVVVNCSNKVEVLDKNTATRIGQVDIPNCRYIKFHEGFAYVTSYAGPVNGESQIGYVAKVDTASLEVVARCLVGYQPDQLEIVEDKIYVANSGGYQPSKYENTVSVIDIASFKEERRITVAVNLHLCKADRHGVLWISSRGDYADQQSGLYAFDTRKNRMVAALDCRVGSMWLDGDSLYVVAQDYNMLTEENETSYAIVDVNRMAVVNRQIITDGTETEISRPYGIAVHPFTNEIFITDARSYVSPGRLHCYGADGVRRWTVRTGDIPGHFVFLGKEK